MTTYVRLVRFSFEPGKHAAVKDLANALLPTIKAQPGCNGATFFGDASEGKYGLYVLWESQANADAASAVHRSQAASGAS